MTLANNLRPQILPLIPLIKQECPRTIKNKMNRNLKAEMLDIDENLSCLVYIDK